MTPDSDWKRLGEAVVSRRVELGMRTREEFAAVIDLSYRSLGDLERGRRPFAPSTLAMVEQALGWTSGSARKVLEGGSPEVDASAAGAPYEPSRDDLVSLSLHPSRSRARGEHEIPRGLIFDLLVNANHAYKALSDVAENADGDTLRALVAPTAELHKAAMHVVHAWFGGPDRLNDLTETIAALYRDTPTDSDAAMDLLDKISAPKTD